MENVKFSLFDILVYAIPGSIVLLAAVICLDASLITPFDINTILHDNTITASIAVLVASYILGFAIDSPGSWIYYRIGCKIWGEPYNPKNKYLHATERVLVRHFSPENYSYVQTWKVMKNMSHNLSCAALILGAASIIKIFRSPTQYRLEWLIFAVAVLVGGIIFLRRASVFDRWSYRDLSEAVRTLRLEKRALNESTIKGNGNQDSEILEDLLKRVKEEV